YRLAAASARKRFQGFVPADNTPGVIFHHDTNIDRFDDVLAEVLQALIFTRLLLEGPIQPGILDRDSNIVGDGFQQFEIFARQIISVLGSAKSDVCDYAVLDPARNEVVQIMQFCFEENVGALGGGFQERKIRIVGKDDAGSASGNETLRISRIFQEDCSAI